MAASGVACTCELLANSANDAAEALALGDGVDNTSIDGMGESHAAALSGARDEDGSEKGEGKDEEKEYDVIIRGFGSSQGGKYGLGPRTDQLLDFSASPDVLFICLLLTVFLIIGVIMGGPPPQSYEQEYAAEIEAYRAKKAEDARAEAQAAAAALSAPPPVAEGTPAPPLD
eukprot:PRCOL_00006781-RA